MVGPMIATSPVSPNCIPGKPHKFSAWALRYYWQLVIHYIARSCLDTGTLRGRKKKEGLGNSPKKKRLPRTNLKLLRQLCSAPDTFVIWQQRTTGWKRERP